MPEIHTKFTLNGKRFGVKHRGRLRGINRDVELYQYDGEKWNHLERAEQDDVPGASGVGKLTDGQLEQWGKQAAEFFA